MKVRPCGACRELVPEESGCRHWIGLGRHNYREAQRRREEARLHRLAARERLAEDIKRFHEKMGYGNEGKA